MSLISCNLELKKKCVAKSEGFISLFLNSDICPVRVNSLNGTEFYCNKEQCHSIDARVRFVLYNTGIFIISSLSVAPWKPPIF